MVSDGLGMAGDFRKRAAELRRVAETFEHAGAESDLLVLAERWEAMADELEGQEVDGRG